MYRPFEAFRITAKCVSVIGSGGKTTLLRYLSGRLPGSVILTTSTHIFPFPGIPLVDSGSENAPGNRERVLREIRSALARSRVVCLGQRLPSGQLASPASVIPFEDLLPDRPVKPEHVAAVLNRENLADCYRVNQADTLPDPEAARRLCELLSKDAYIVSLLPR